MKLGTESPLRHLFLVESHVHLMCLAGVSVTPPTAGKSSFGGLGAGPCVPPLQSIAFFQGSHTQLNRRGAGRGVSHLVSHCNILVAVARPPEAVGATLLASAECAVQLKVPRSLPRREAPKDEFVSRKVQLKALHVITAQM